MQLFIPKLIIKHTNTMNENQNIEWKSSWRDEYLKWVCAFANEQSD